MLVLGIESSCDETAVALVRDGREVLSSLVSSQIAVHARFGGVVPEVAAREHLKVIQGLYIQALKDASVRAEDIDAIAVTQGPGLIGALLVGASFAKGLSLSLNVPLIPVDHVHAHVHGALLGLTPEQKKRVFPALSLVVSGGHTNLYYMENPTHFRLLAATVDDACGECFDKVGKLMGLPYPGGPVIEKMARKGSLGRFTKMPKMVPEKKKMIFSYSGLKTHMAYLWEREGPFTGQELNDLAYAFQEEAFGQLKRKVMSGLSALETPVRSLLVAGGVAANQRFRAMLSELPDIECFFPKLTYCSDNGAMIAGLGWHEYQRMSGKEENPWPDQNWDAYSRYQFEKVLGS